MNSSTVLTLAVAAGFAGGFVGSIFLAPAGSADDSASSGEIVLYANEADLRALTERMQAVESATNSHDLSLGILDGRYDELAARIPRGVPGTPGEGNYGPSGELAMAPGSIPTGPGFDAAVAAVIQQREEADAAERQRQREERQEEALKRRAEQLATEIGLDARQTEQLVEAMRDAQTKREEAFTAMRESGNFDRDQARASMEQLRAVELESVAKFMTPEQVTKYQESGASNAFGGRGGQQGFGGGGGRGTPGQGRGGN